MSEEEKQFVMPGDLIGTTEEFTAGEGTYVDVGDIHSISTGYVNIDRKSRTISVVPKTKTPPELCEGDIVIGGITNLRDSVVLVDIGGIKGKGEREFQMDGLAAIHVSNVRDSYVKNLSQEFSMSDIVKAKVINTQNMRLTTSEKSLGVMKAYCSRCRSELQMDGKRLKCPSCGRTEKRKVSSDYGTGIF
ncbi:exosome complex RNA-binding protein Csl4 [Methanolobus zinderi]|uniref:Exosome complex component Csl4 n=1 Tax=Methanolobus zinderi TaxID=536044 RepID=A0A7D5EAD5_9EURY|nr:exosome complex RNA-binding protein Csl4 [Methanolobus zinderi]QLC50835.1 exosome complex RNA-binding protein Csl4 [Methanolobus zinderi]